MNRASDIVRLCLCMAGLMGFLPACNPGAPDEITRPSASIDAREPRLISMAPGITEVLFDLDLGESVVGVTRFCDYPPQALDVAKIGGFIDPNFEVIVSLKPDVVFLYRIHGDSITRLNSLGIRTMEVDHRTLDGILDSIRAIGAECGMPEKAEKHIRDLERRMQAISDRTSALPRPRVLISAGREWGGDQIGDVYVAGRNEWYDDLIEMAGGVNAFEDESIQFPTLSAEGLLLVDPDVIVEMVPNIDTKSYSAEDVIYDWSALGTMQAVKDEKVFVLAADYATIPGPRFIHILEDLAKLLHPEIDWSEK